MSLAEHVIHVQFCLTIIVVVIGILAVGYAFYAYMVSRLGK